MAISAAVTAGPNITTLSDIKFSTLRKHFLKAEPRDTYSGSESFPGDTGPVSASQLLRQTSFTDDGVSFPSGVESDIDYKVPAVPNCTENSAVATSTNWKTSQFVNAIKYYYLQQTGADDLNLNISSQSWNGNLDDNIRKWFFIDATIGSNTATAAATLSATTNNLSIKISSTGAIYGKSGSAGVGGAAGGDGGDAFAWSDSSSTNNYLILLSGAKLYAGGGGGGQGAGGGNGGQGGEGGRNNVFCNTTPAGTGYCSEDKGPGGSGGSAIAGAAGGTGAGYSNQTPNISGAPGYQSNDGLNSTTNGGGKGGRSGYNTPGGSGGTFGGVGIPGPSAINNTSNQKGVTGGGGQIYSSGTFCGGGGVSPPGIWIPCTGRSTSGFTGSNGVDGTLGGAAGKSIKRSVTTVPYVLITANFTDNIKGAQST